MWRNTTSISLALPKIMYKISYVTSLKSCIGPYPTYRITNISEYSVLFPAGTQLLLFSLIDFFQWAPFPHPRWHFPLRFNWKCARGCYLLGCLYFFPGPALRSPQYHSPWLLLLALLASTNLSCQWNNGWILNLNKIHIHDCLMPLLLLNVNTVHWLLLNS